MQFKEFYNPYIKYSLPNVLNESFNYNDPMIEFESEEVYCLNEGLIGDVFGKVGQAVKGAIDVSVGAVIAFVKSKLGNIIPEVKLLTKESWDLVAKIYKSYQEKKKQLVTEAEQPKKQKIKIKRGTYRKIKPSSDAQPANVGGMQQQTQGQTQQTQGQPQQTQQDVALDKTLQEQGLNNQQVQKVKSKTENAKKWLGLTGKQWAWVAAITAVVAIVITVIVMVLNKQDPTKAKQFLDNSGTTQGATGTTQQVSQEVIQQKLSVYGSQLRGLSQQNSNPGPFFAKIIQQNPNFTPEQLADLASSSGIDPRTMTGALNDAAIKFASSPDIANKLDAVSNIIASGG